MTWNWNALTLEMCFVNVWVRPLIFIWKIWIFSYFVAISFCRLLVDVQFVCWRFVAVVCLMPLFRLFGDMNVKLDEINFTFQMNEMMLKKKKWRKQTSTRTQEDERKKKRRIKFYFRVLVVYQFDLFKQTSWHK